jgi:hypothetical protein
MKKHSIALLSQSNRPWQQISPEVISRKFKNSSISDGMDVSKG